VYFPYLAGSGAPHMNSFARGGFLGISTDTTREQMLLALYEGIAFESKLILESFGLGSVHEMTACGGLSAHRKLMQIMADVLCLPIRVLEAEECTLYGAASLAFLDAGVTLPRPAEKDVFVPRPEKSVAYDSVYRKSYLPLQKALLAYYGSKQESIPDNG
jgi:xylulokinase